MKRNQIITFVFEGGKPEEWERLKIKNKGRFSVCQDFGGRDISKLYGIRFLPFLSHLTHFTPCYQCLASLAFFLATFPCKSFCPYLKLSPCPPCLTKFLLLVLSFNIISVFVQRGLSCLSYQNFISYFPFL